MEGIVYQRLKHFERPEIGTRFKIQIYTFGAYGYNFKGIGFINENDVSRNWDVDTQIPLVNGMELKLLNMVDSSLEKNNFFVKLDGKSFYEIIDENKKKIQYFENSLQICRNKNSEKNFDFNIFNGPLFELVGYTIKKKKLTSSLNEIRSFFNIDYYY